MTRCSIFSNNFARTTSFYWSFLLLLKSVRLVIGRSRVRFPAGSLWIFHSLSKAYINCPWACWGSEQQEEQQDPDYELLLELHALTQAARSYVLLHRYCNIMHVGWHKCRSSVGVKQEQYNTGGSGMGIRLTLQLKTSTAAMSFHNLETVIPWTLSHWPAGIGRGRYEGKATLSLKQCIWKNRRPNALMF